MLSGSIVMSLEYYTGIRDGRQHRNTAEFWCAEKEARKKKHVLNWTRTWQHRNTAEFWCAEKEMSIKTMY